MACVRFIFAMVPSIAIAQLPPAVTLPPPLLFTHVVERSITIELGDAIEVVRPVPVVPTTVTAGTRVRIVAKSPGEKYRPVKWFKGLTELTVTGATLEIVAATSADTASYHARVMESDGHSEDTGEAFLFVDDHEGQRLLNASARVQLTLAQPSFTAGFTIQPGPWQVLVLVRVVGPSLARFGVQDALPAPQLRVFDDRGDTVTPTDFTTTSMTVDEATSKVGAFPLVSGGADVAQLFYVRPGGYTAQASAASGSSGTVVLEIYQVPLR